MNRHNTKEFLGVLKKLKSGISTREIIQSSDCYIFTENQLTTYNDSLCVTVPYEGFLSDSFGERTKITVPHKELFDLVSKITSDDFTMEYAKGELHIGTKRIKSAIRTVTNSKIPIDAILDIELDTKHIQTYDGTSSFTDALRACVETADADSIDVILGCIHIYKNGIESTDQYQITRAKMPINIFPSDDEDGILLSKDVARELCNFSIEKLVLSSNKSWLCAMCSDGFQVFCRVIKASYLDIDHIFKVKNKKDKIEIILPSTFNEILDRVLVFSKEETKTQEQIALEFDNGVLTVTSKNQRGVIQEKVRIKYAGVPFSFTANPHILNRVFKYNHTFYVDNGTIWTKTENGIEILACITNMEVKDET